MQKKNKKKHKELSSIEDRKAKQIFVTKEKNSFLTLQIQCRCYHGPRGPCPPFWFTKNIFLEHYVTRKSTMILKRVTFNLTYLTEVTYISSIGVARGGPGGPGPPPIKIPLTTNSYDNIAWRCLVAVFF